jgi:hypothetical protein
MVIDEIFVITYCSLLMVIVLVVIGDYYINGYNCIFYCGYWWLLMIIILMVVDDYYINGYK